MTYFDVPLISNSFLTRIDKIIQGKEMPDRDAAFWKDGNEFEDALLFNKPTNSSVIKAMVCETKNHPTFKKIFGDPRIKLQHEFYGKFMGIGFKGKADGVIKGVVVPDIKSTSCTSQEAFLKSVVEYQYDRQIYIYTQIFKCPLGCLIATSKQKNPKIFIVPISEGSYLWHSGREKTEHLVSIVKSLY